MIYKLSCKINRLFIEAWLDNLALVLQNHSLILWGILFFWQYNPTDDRIKFRSDCVAVIEEAELYQGKDSGTHIRYPIILSSRLFSK